MPRMFNQQSTDFEPEGIPVTIKVRFCFDDDEIDDYLIYPMSYDELDLAVAPPDWKLPY